MKVVVFLVWTYTLVASLNPKVLLAKAKVDELREALLDLERELLRDDYGIEEWVEEAGERIRIMTNELANAEWNFETNVNNQTQEEQIQVSMRTAIEAKSVALEAREKQRLLLTNPELRRRLRILAKYSDPSNDEVLKELEQTSANMLNIYATATLKRDGQTYSMEPELSKLFAQERNPDLLEWAWKGWRDATGKKLKTMYPTFIKLLNEGAIENGYKDYGEAWRSSQFDDTPELMQMCAELWAQVEPLYLKLHTYVKMKLKQYYSREYPHYNFPMDGTIPAHLLGNMWAQNWEEIYSIVKPYPSVQEIDVTDEMVKQNYTVNKLFTMAEEFYTSLGLEPMTETFWEKSMFVRPPGREVQCHASASDFATREGKQNRNKDDFRIKMCTEIDVSYFETIHHEMGHIQYFMEYRDQPMEYRSGANSAFHEAIGDTISLSVLTDKHLKTVGLKQDTDFNVHLQYMQDINILMKRALFKISFLPFGYMIDMWRFKVFDGSITEQNFNREWWKHRLEYQGLSSPVTRSEEDFDPGAKFHIPSNSPYICYFISFIVQFQMYESLCKESGHTGSLHTCDFYRSKEAGQKLQSFLKLGMSRPWRDALETLTGSRDVKTESIIEYFKPLSNWLDRQLEGKQQGWEKAQINFQ